LEFFFKILTQTAQVAKLLGGAKILRKCSTFWIGHNNVTDRGQTDGPMP